MNMACCQSYVDVKVPASHELKIKAPTKGRDIRGELDSIQALRSGGDSSSGLGR